MFFSKDMICKYIPHRPPFLLVDHVKKLTPFETAEGILELAGEDAWYFKGHFPNTPLFPGVLLLEFMAQTASFLVAYSLQMPQGENPVYLMSIDHAKFRDMCFPKETLTCSVEIIRRKEHIWKFQTHVCKQDDVKVCEAKFMAMMVQE